MLPNQVSANADARFGIIKQSTTACLLTTTIVNNKPPLSSTTNHHHHVTAVANSRHRPPPSPTTHDHQPQQQQCGHATSPAEREPTRRHAMSMMPRQRTRRSHTRSQRGVPHHRRQWLRPTTITAAHNNNSGCQRTKGKGACRRRHGNVPRHPDGDDGKHHHRPHM